jgi:hypothetical protein
MTTENTTYLAQRGAIATEYAAYWVEGRFVVGLAFHQRPGDEKYEPAAPWTIAMWAEVQRLRAALEARGDAALGRIEQEREAMRAERDAALAEVERMRGLVADAEGRLRDLLDYNPGPAGLHPVPWTTRPEVTAIADLLTQPAQVAK